MRVLIVDDEKLAREAIEHIIVSSDYDMKVVAQAQNAKEALSMYKMYNPDVIITDICMDGEDGLNLIEEIHRYDSNSNVIVLSAYEKFEYAKKAYESGAEFYLLKPIDENELIRILLIFKERIESNKKEIEDISKNFIAVRDNYFKELFLDPFVDADNFNEICNVFGIHSSQRFVVAKVFIDSFYVLTKDEQKEAENALKVAIQYFELIYNGRCVQIQISNCEWAVVEFFDEQKEDEAIIMKLNGAFLSLQEQFELIFDKTKISIGISKIYSNPQYMLQAYNEANEMICSTAWQGKGSVINKESITPYVTQGIFMTRKELDEICTACIANDYEAIQLSIDKYFGRITGIQYVEIMVLYNVVAEAVISIIRNITKNANTIFDVFEERIDLFSEIRTCKNLADIKTWFEDKMKQVLKYTNKNNSSENLTKIINIIEKEYSNLITVEDIAEKLYFSPSYLMRLFKYETGQTLHAYITEHRIKKAVELLKRGDLKISEVSVRVGYADSNYFGQVFKRVMGITPQKYMKGLK